MTRLIDTAVKVILASGIVVLFVLHFDSIDSVVYVDSQRLVMGYKGMTVARQEFEVKVTGWKSNLDTLNSEVENSIKDYERKRSGLTAKERQLTEELIRSKQQQFVNYQQVVQEKIQKEDEELSRKVMDKVNEYMKKYGRQKGYKIILAATQYGNIVYAEDMIDVTDEVMKGLNDEYR